MSFSRQHGLTLTELMISVAVGLFVVLAATGLLLAVQRSYSTQDDLLRIDENGGYALEVLARTVRHAGYADPERAQPPLPAVLGLDASTLTRDTPDLSGAKASDINGSDVLALRHDVSETGQGVLLNCAGFPAAPAADGYAWSIFYLARDASGEPQLYCKYPGQQNWTADAIVGGVEGFQVLYGIDADDDGLPDRMLNAGAMGTAGDDAAAQWSQVVTVRVALLLRGSVRQAQSRDDMVHDLFGPQYSAQRAAGDPGVQLSESVLAAADGQRLRKTMEATIRLRNPARRDAKP